MSTYVIGDVQGCFYQLQQLLTHIQFHPQRDTLWFTGDLVNRGPQSLEVLRFVKSLNNKSKIVLGNHDLHLLAVFYGARQMNPGDTFTDILMAPDAPELMYWLKSQSLFYYDEQSNIALVHAGVAPMWTIEKAVALAHEVEVVLCGDGYINFFKNMYGNEPALWQENLTGHDRLRCITNYFTRMRFCRADGRLDLFAKVEIKYANDDLIPWFALPNRVNANHKIMFGHWAALGGIADAPNVYALDTGCVWGNCLTALRLEDGKRFSVKC